MATQNLWGRGGDFTRERSGRLASTTPCGKKADNSFVFDVAIATCAADACAREWFVCFAEYEHLIDSEQSMPEMFD